MKFLISLLALTLSASIASADDYYYDSEESSEFAFDGAACHSDALGSGLVAERKSICLKGDTKIYECQEALDGFSWKYVDFQEGCDVDTASFVACSGIVDPSDRAPIPDIHRIRADALLEACRAEIGNLD